VLPLDEALLPDELALVVLELVVEELDALLVVLDVAPDEVLDGLRHAGAT